MECWDYIQETKRMYGFEHIKTDLDDGFKRARFRFKQRDFYMRSPGIYENQFITGEHNESQTEECNDTYRNDRTFYFIKDSPIQRDAKASFQRATFRLNKYIKMKYPIENNVPIPNDRDLKKYDIIETLLIMEPGDSIFVTELDSSQIANILHKHNKIYSTKFVQRKLKIEDYKEGLHHKNELNGIRIFRIN